MHDFSTGKMNEDSLFQPDSPKRNRIYFTNQVADTLLHEAVHALGSREDYMYLPSNNEGKINKIEYSIESMKEERYWRLKDNKRLGYLSKIYFMSNPLYNEFTTSSLCKLDIIRSIFLDDSFFRAIVLLNNPDTISLLIREIAGLGHQSGPSGSGSSYRRL